MRETIYVILVALALVSSLVSYFIVLTRLLRGQGRIQTYVIFTVTLLGLIIAAFFVAGWRSALLAIGIAFAAAIVSPPLAIRRVQSMRNPKSK